MKLPLNNVDQCSILPLELHETGETSCAPNTVINLGPALWGKQDHWSLLAQLHGRSSGTWFCQVSDAIWKYLEPIQHPNAWNQRN